ncbi:MAG: hypothetical protein ACI92O_000303 [Colwellia sp.]|jgi:hypothetical protein
MTDCKCGSKPSLPTKVKGLTKGFVVQCSNLKCPAKSQRIGKQASVNAWDKQATEE